MKVLATVVWRKKVNGELMHRIIEINYAKYIIDNRVIRFFDDKGKEKSHINGVILTPHGIRAKSIIGGDVMRTSLLFVPEVSNE